MLLGLLMGLVKMGGFLCVYTLNGWDWIGLDCVKLKIGLEGIGFGLFFSGLNVIYPCVGGRFLYILNFLFIVWT